MYGCFCFETSWLSKYLSKVYHEDIKWFMTHEFSVIPISAVHSHQKAITIVKASIIEAKSFPSQHLHEKWLFSIFRQNFYHQQMLNPLLALHLTLNIKVFLLEEA